MNFYPNSFYLPYTFHYIDTQPVESFQDSYLSNNEQTYAKNLET